jgi:hypothetical protein
MSCSRHASYSGPARTVVCALACFCIGLFAAFAHAAAPQNMPTAPSKNAGKPGWNFQAPDRSVQNTRWRESIQATLQQTTFAPSAPAGRYLQHNATSSGKGLPPAQLDDLDKMRPPENAQLTLGGSTPVHGEFTKEKTAWRPHNDPADPAAGVTSVLKEERRAGAYADFRPAEDVELMLGPEYHFGASALRPDQTGSANRDNAGSFGMGMKLKIDF